MRQKSPIPALAYLVIDCDYNAEHFPELIGTLHSEAPELVVCEPRVVLHTGASSRNRGHQQRAFRHQTA